MLCAQGTANCVVTRFVTKSTPAVSGKLHNYMGQMDAIFDIGDVN